MTAKYTLPAFNLQCNIWRATNPTSNPPDVISSCNLCLGRRENLPAGAISTGAFYPGAMWLLLPAGTDIQDSKNGGAGDVVEVGAGTGRFYDVTWVDDAGSGFSNEHRHASLLPHGTWPTPFPRPGVAPTPAAATFQAANVAFPGGAPNAIVLPSLSDFLVVMVCDANAGGTTGTLVSSITGAHAVTFSSRYPAAGPFKAWMNWYVFPASGSPETITYTPVGGDISLMEIFNCNKGVLDQSNTASGIVQPATQLTFSTVANAEAWFAAFLFEDYNLNNVNGSFSSPWGAMTPGVANIGTWNLTHTLALQMSVLLNAPIGAPAVTLNYTPPAAVWGGSLITLK